MNLKKNLLWALSAFMMIAVPVATFTSCGGDDDNGNGGSDGGTEISIPASVVDGVRVQSIVTDNGEQALNIDYNSDGTVSRATMGGCEYTFEYASSTRAAEPTGRKLVRVYTKEVENDGEVNTWSATNFQFNTDGFVASYLEKFTENGKDDDGSSYSYNANVNVTCSYTAAGRIARIGLAGKQTGYDEGEQINENINTSVNYVYTGGSLSKVSFSYAGEVLEYTFGYDYAPTNTYNYMTPQMCKAMMTYSPLPYILAQTGYLGNASSQLPTKMTRHSYSNYSDGDPNYDEWQTTNISYSLWDNNRIKSISESYDGGRGYNYQLTFFSMK